MNKEAKSEDRLISVESVAERLDISVRGVYRLVSAGVLAKPVKVGRSTKFFGSDVQTYFDSLRAGREVSA